MSYTDSNSAGSFTRKVIVMQLHVYEHCCNVNLSGSLGKS